MKFPRHAQIAKGPLDLVPALNVVMLLLMFFLLSSAVMISPGTSIELPASASFSVAPGPALVVTVASDDLIFFRDRRFKRAEIRELESVLISAAKESSIKTLTLNADKQVSYDLLVQITDAATRAGLEKVNLATRPLPSAP